MTGQSLFSEIITTEEQLREIIGYPNRLIAELPVSALDAVCRDFIARSPFVLISSADARGSLDISPKGDPAGFVHVLDDTTLLIPDRPGNRRADTFMNILQNPRIGLLFLIPGRRETLRISGQAALIQDVALCQKMAIREKVPKLLIAVSVEQAFFHCPKCILRSELWNIAALPEPDDLSFLAQAIVKQGKLDKSIDEIQTMVNDVTDLY